MSLITPLAGTAMGAAMTDETRLHSIVASVATHICCRYTFRMELDSVQKAAQEQFAKQSHRYGRGHVLENIEDLRSAQERVLSQLQSQVRDLAIELAEKVVGQNLDRERNLALVDQFIAELNASR